MNDRMLAPYLTPHGRLNLRVEEDAIQLEDSLAQRLRTAFAQGTGAGLLQLGGGETGRTLPPVWAYWREFSSRYVSAVCALPSDTDRTGNISIPPPSDEVLESLAGAAPAMMGAEYLTGDVLRQFWGELETEFNRRLAASGGQVQSFLKSLNPAWNVVGRVHFNLAENRKDPETPFAFLATYTTRLSAQAKPQHVPLGQALREYASAADKERLLSLLLPVQRAAEHCAWLKAMVDNGEIFHPLRWVPSEAIAFLRDAPLLEAAGVIVRLPVVWKGDRPPRPKVSVTVGSSKPSALGYNALLQFQVEVTLGGQRLTQQEIQEILARSEGLALIRGQWIEIDRDRLSQVLKHFQKVEKTAAGRGITFGEAMRMLAGADVGPEASTDGAGPDWSEVIAGPWLADILKGLRRPEGLAKVDPGNALHGALRPYQTVGVRWLYLIAKLGLGACLADDMGLGKTIQILALLLVLKREQPNRRRPALLVAPASLLANWAAEIERFAPSLRALTAHASAMSAADLKAFSAKRLDDVDLVITTYGSLLRTPWLTETPWSMAVLDEAQAIKNPGTKQAQAVKSLRALARFALTGTPVENRLGDLWSIFDFLNPGLLGSAREFAAMVKRLEARQHNPYAPLRDLVRPYILRRLKTDKSVIADLPDKTEITAYCHLTRQQAALYQQAVDELADALDNAEGIQRRGIVLAYLMRFKQICNHPSQWLGDSAWNDEASGKYARLRELAGEIAARQEKALVFTQFREITAPLANFLGSVFGRAGLVLHGQTPVKQRQALVRQFQEEDGPPFFILSLKAGGTGLNLTAAAHVIHFDRWWNPAVENQATDRAFRIGQTKNVLVHKFVCQGTIEERIHAMIQEKKQLSVEVLEGGAELILTELSDAELLRLVALDLNSALKDF